MSIRRNWLAVAVASLVYFALGGAWFTFLLQPWLNGIGRTREQIMDVGVSPAVTYGSAVITTVVIALFLSWIIPATGPQTALRGVKVAAWTWLGIVFATFSTEYAFEARSFQALAVVAGYPLAGMLLMGAILGAWKAKSTLRSV